MSSVLLQCIKRYIVLKYEKIYIETIEKKLVFVDLLMPFWIKERKKAFLE